MAVGKSRSLARKSHFAEFFANWRHYGIYDPVISGALKASEARGATAGAPPAFLLSANFAKESFGPLPHETSKIPYFQMEPIAAAPALLGLVAAITLPAQSIPESASSSAISHRAESAPRSQVSSALLVSAIHWVAASKPAVVRHAASTASPGTPSGRLRQGQLDRPEGLPRPVRVAGPLLGQPEQVAGRQHPGGAGPDGRWAPGACRQGPRQLGPTHTTRCPRRRSRAGRRANASSLPSAPARTATTYRGDSSFQECVIARESGGNSQVMNSSGHYGLYQFSASTWAATAGTRPTSVTPAWPSRTGCSTTPSPPAASTTGRPTTAADRVIAGSGRLATAARCIPP